mgnify:CR=1 FL=1
MARRAGLRFTERMHGVVACGSSDDPYANAGGLGWQPFEFTLDARIPDVSSFLRDEQHPIELPRGVVRSGHFGACRVTGGEINLMVPGEIEVERLMGYRVCFTTSDGTELTLLGFKDVEGDRLRMWYDTTRVFAEVYRGTLSTHDERHDHPLVAVGVLEIPAITFLIQLTTFRATGGLGVKPAAAYVRFMVFFARSLIQPYLLGLVLRTKEDVHQAKPAPDVEELLREPGRLAESA